MARKRIFASVLLVFVITSLGIGYAFSSLDEDSEDQLVRQRKWADQVWRDVHEKNETAYARDRIMMGGTPNVMTAAMTVSAQKRNRPGDLFAETPEWRA